MILDRPYHDPLKIDRGTCPQRSITSKYIQILLWQDRRGFWNVRVQHKTRGYLGWGSFRDRRQAEGYFDFLVEDWTMRTNFTKEDSDFLRECGIAADVKPDAESDALMLQRHPELGSGMLLEQIAELMITEISKMSPDEKAILRARMSRRSGLIKTGGGKPS